MTMKNSYGDALKVLQEGNKVTTIYSLQMTHHYIRTAAAFAVFAFAGTVSAAVNNLGEIEMGKVYAFSQGDEVKGTYTAPETGMYKFVYTGLEIPVYPDDTYDVPVEHTFFYGDGTRNWMVPLEEGQKVYFYSSSKSTMSDGTMMLAAPPESLELTSVSPGLEPGTEGYYGGELSASRHYRMTFFFSDQVTCTSASLRFPDGSYSSCATQISGASIQVGFSTQIMDAYREGKLKKGDTAKIRLVGVRCTDFPDVRYGSNGRLEVEFTVAGKPIELERMVNGPKPGESMLSYYLPGSDSGIISMEFDGDIAVNAQNPAYALLVYGNPEDLEHQVYNERVPVTIDGNVLKIDLTGKLRRPIDMVPGIAPEAAEKYIALRVGNVCSTDGQAAYTGSMSSFSTFNYAFTIETLSYTYATDFTPARGASVWKGCPVELWVMNGSRISFDNITLSTVRGGEPVEVVIGKDDLEISADPDDEEALLVNFIMSDLAADDGAAVTVTPGNVFFADGVDHASDLVGSYVWTNESGVDATEAVADGKADVYSVTGVRVLRDASRADLRTLPAGVYIHGNRKVIVR